MKHVPIDASEITTKTLELKSVYNQIQNLETTMEYLSECAEELESEIEELRAKIAEDVLDSLDNAVISTVDDILA